MIWQDIVFSIGSVIFATSLIPMAANKETKVPLKSSGPTAAVLWAYTATMFTLGLPVGAVLTGATASMWTFIAVRRRL